MLKAPRSAWVLAVAGVLAVASAILLGVSLRADDPLSTPVVPAEDPYTHMAYVREHLRDGDLDPLNGKGTMYPPGLHAFMAAWWSFTGTDLYEITRIGPVVLGGIGILGVALVLWRHAGPMAAFVGSLAYALAPEMIFRTTMMSPTAVDLALVPFLLFALLEVVRGRLAWSGVAAAVSLFLVIAHPWLFIIIGLTGAMFCVFAFLLPWSSKDAWAMSPHGLATAAAIVAGATALTLFTGPGFLGTLQVVPGASIGVPLPLLALFIALPLVTLPFLLLRFVPQGRDTFLVRLAARPPGPIRRSMTAVLLAGILWWVTRTALQAGLPDHIDLPRMFGWPILALAMVAFVGLPFMARPVANLGAAFAAATYPFVIFNPLDSPFWPHRTAVFFGISLALLAGVGAGAILRGLAMAAAWWTRSSKASTGLRARPALSIALPLVLAVPVLGLGVYAGTPVDYGGWYRLYQPCEMDALKAAGEIAGDDPDAVYITGSWQSKLVLAALVPDASRIWYKPEFFFLDQHREDFTESMIRAERPIVVVVDRYLTVEHPEARTDFLADAPWQAEEDWCRGLGGFDRPRVIAYSLQGE